MTRSLGLGPRVTKRKDRRKPDEISILLYSRLSEPLKSEESQPRAHSCWALHHALCWDGLDPLKSWIWINILNLFLLVISSQQWKKVTNTATQTGLEVPETLCPVSGMLGVEPTTCSLSNDLAWVRLTLELLVYTLLAALSVCKQFLHLSVWRAFLHVCHTVLKFSCHLYLVFIIQ